MKVFAVFTCGMDYYDRLELDKLFFDRDAAEAYATEQRLVVEDPEEYPEDLEDDEDVREDKEPFYSLVKVEEWTVQ